MLARKIDEYCAFTYDEKVIVGVSEKKNAKKAEMPKMVLRAHTNHSLNVNLRKKLLCLSLVVVFMIVLMAVQNKIAVDRSYEIAKIKTEINKMQKDNEVMKLDISKLKSPQRIEQIAVAQLGMTNPKAIYYVKNDVAAANNLTQSNDGATAKTGSIAQASERKIKTGNN